MKVIWTPEAKQDRSDVWDYIAADNPYAAVRMDEQFSDAASNLARHPMLAPARENARHSRAVSKRELSPGI
ncbi:type II toxin-antitoxin system RelE/ParE family toxin [Photorhabdus hindustanensis]|uniref:type II toxin-antitoxin system RelE/ParE family toxin n=1 Tax=Photorhabdus hindustanensis TaxID=2918802 RepID=UPI003BB79814